MAQSLNAGSVAELALAASLGATLAQWSATQPGGYASGSIVGTPSGLCWKSLVNANSTQPTVNNASWVIVS